MSDAKEIARRLLLVAGAVVAAILIVIGTGIWIEGAEGNRKIGAGFLFTGVLGFALWRWAVNWVLLYKAPVEPPRSF